MKAKKQQQPEPIKQVTVRLPESDWRRIAHLAVDLGVSIHDLILTGLNEVLAKHRQAPIKTKSGAN